ncbi:MAG TPA: autotransporter-associated beta strand repeat-containing protein [Chthoniobacteraceae bacterium]|nr:autotransporter-associated beta strand repeat-containing protein [Chthoniobacteraceae bacterium]
MDTFRIAALMGAALSWGFADADAQTLSWDTDSGTPGAQGGSGNWVATPFWFNGVENVQWIDSQLASFGGAAGNVAVNSNVTVNGLVFSVGGYTISGTSTLMLANPIIDVTGVNVASISAPIGGSAGLVKNGPGTLAILAGLPNTYTGTTSINDGTLFVNKTGSDAVNGDVIIGDNLGAAGSASLVAGVSHQIPDNARVTVNADGHWNLAGGGERIETIGTLEMTGGLVSASLGVGRLTFSALQTNASVQAAMITGQVDLGGAMRTFSIADGASATDLEVTATVSNGGITKTGAGTLTLSGTNSFANTVAINGGAISVADLTDIGVAGPLGVGSSFSMDGGRLIFSALAADSTNRAIALGPGGGTLQIDTFGPAVTFSGVISGSGSLTKMGGGGLTLTGTNTFTGPLNLLATSTRVTGLADSGVASPIGAGTTINLNNGGISVFGGGTHSTNRNITLGLFGGQLDASSSTTTVYSGDISGVGYLVASSIGGGLVVLSGTNTFGGDVFITQSTSRVRIANGNAIPNSAAVQLANGAMFDLNGTAETIGSLRNSGPGGGTVTLGGGTLTLGGDNEPATFSGAISGAGGVVKIGTGIQTLNGASNFTGALAINGGTISVPDVSDNGVAGPLGAGGSMSFATGGTLEYTSAASDSTNRSITLNTGGGRLRTAPGAALLTLAGPISGPGSLTTEGFIELTATNTFTGSLNVASGILHVPSVANDNTPSPLGAGASISINDAALILAGSTTQSTNRSLTITGTASLSPGNGTLTWAGSIFGPGSLSVTGPGTLVLSGNNSFAGGASVFNGTLRVGGGNAIPNTAALFLSPLHVPAAFDLNNGTETIGSLSGGGPTNGAVLLGSGTLTIGDFSFSIPASSYDGVISGTGNLVKSGFAQLTLTRASTFTGTTTILNGPLEVMEVADSGVASPLGAGSSLIFGATNGSGTLLFSGASNDSTNRPITLSGQGGSVNVSNAATLLTLSGPISGAGGLGKFGPGTLVLSGANNYQGTTLAAAGLLRLLGGNAIGDDSRVFFAAGTFDLNNTSEVVGSLSGGSGGGGAILLGSGTLTTGGNGETTTYSGTISGSGGLTKIGTGTMTLNGVNAYSGPTNVNAGRIQFGGGNAIGNSSALTVSLNAVAEWLSGSETIGSLAGDGDAILGTGSSLIVGANNNSTNFSGTISGTGSLTTLGTGTLTLSSAPTYTGVTNVNAGTLSLNGGFDTTGAAITIAADASLMARNVISRPILGTGTIAATGTLTVGDSNSTSGFNFGGTLVVGTQQVILADADLADLGPTTTLAAGGRLNSLNGIRISSGRSITAGAAVSASIGGNLLNNGTVNGPPQPGAFLSLTGDVTGTGNFTGNVRFTDSFSPGNGAATVSLQNFIFESTHALTLEIGGLAAGSLHDRLVFTGSGTIDGNLIVLLTGGFKPVEGNTFTVFAGGSLNGSFDSLALPPLDPGLAWDYRQTASDALLVVIPEPSTTSLLVTVAVTGLGLFRRNSTHR